MTSQIKSARTKRKIEVQRLDKINELQRINYHLEIENKRLIEEMETDDLIIKRLAWFSMGLIITIIGMLVL